MTPLQHYSTAATDAKASPRKTTLVTAIAMAIGGISLNAQAALTSSASLSFDAGFNEITSCLDGSDPATGCSGFFAQQTDIGGSWFRLNQGGPANAEKIPISQFAPIHIGSTQTSSGQHTGTVNGSESPAIDNPWNFYFDTGMHTLTSPISVISDFGSTKTLDFSGWGMNWGNLGPGGGTGGTLLVGGTATIVCSTSSCSDSSTYTLDMDVHIPVALSSVPYSLHLEGKVNSAVPVPAAAWLFGSGIIGLAGIARRRRNKA